MVIKEVNSMKMSLIVIVVVSFMSFTLECSGRRKSVITFVDETESAQKHGSGVISSFVTPVDETDLNAIKIEDSYLREWYLLAGVGAVCSVTSVIIAGVHAYQDCTGGNEDMCVRSQQVVFQQLCGTISFLGAACATYTKNNG